MRGDRLLGVSFGCFIGLGMSDASLGAAWPQIRSTFGVRLDALGLLLLLSTIGFTASGLAMGRLMGRFGSAVVIGAGLGGMCFSLLLFGTSPAWPGTMLAILLLGLSAAPVDAGLPPSGTSAEAIMHAALTSGDGLLMGADDPSGNFGGTVNGMCVNCSVQDGVEAKRIFEALSTGGQVQMPLGETFFSPAFGMCIARFGTPWMVMADSPTEP